MNDSSLIGTTIARGDHRILVVDDHPTTRYSTARTLRAAGFVTEEAATGNQALQRAALGVSAVVLDVHLPDIDGLEVCRRLRNDARTANLPVIHLSATFVDDQDKVQGLDAGADAYLVHPAEPAVLVATLQALIRARSAEDRLGRSESRFRAIYNQVPNGMALLDREGRLEDVNPALVNLLGRSATELIGRGMQSLAAPGAEEAAHSFTAQAIWLATQAGEPWHTEFALQHADGHEVMLAWSLSPLGPGEPVAAVATDISARQSLERARQEVLEREQAARAMAERHSRTKDDFVAVLSHELRTPLNAISGWVHILLKHGNRPELIAKALDAIARSVAAQSRIIGDILDVSRVNAGKLRLHREWVDPVTLARSAIDGLREDIASRQIVVRFLEEGEPARPAHLDPTRFQQVVWNLVSNAVKFSPVGGQIDVGLAREQQTLVLRVRDRGKGIPASFLPQLFDRFTQSDGPDNRQHGGLGLGLSIVKRLAELHGGSVQAFSEGEGLGATLEVRLQVGGDATGDAPHALQPAAAMAPQAGSEALRGQDILVVEDSADAAEMLQIVLHEAGAQVRVAGDYPAAMAALAQRWPSMMVSDIGLPGRDGYELMREFRRLEQDRAQPARARCIALSAFTRDQDRERALEAGFDLHLPKPLDAQALLAALRGA
ncbi:response regulator [Xenophilus arseniciresistens]|uniref:histidine kinase n=1 Tax=Xenophilus arseniciresistens TaxID=1283306 RepID=A0AAE3SYU7_9BURK|nr:response regulator [Xenophilus arseniciresistens]MDA7416419.1 response regulator [Xenophilus arseniciresistens]